MTEPTNDNILDVAIVGAGVAGVYSGWRLMRDSNPTAYGGARPKITVFETSNRVGGRLLSLTPPGMPKTRCELGGMRFMSRHVLVGGLVEYFDLETVEMPVYEDGNIVYLRGRQFRMTDLTDPSKLPYHFTSAEKSQLAQNLLMYALYQIVPNCTKLSYNDLLIEMQTATFDGQPLHQQGFWNILARILSPDAYNFVRDTGGYDCLVSNWSAADAIPFILADFGAGVTYSRIVDGYIRVPELLADEFTNAGGKIECCRTVASIDTIPQDGSDTPLVAVRFRENDDVVYARSVILAMPRRSLELMDPKGVLLDRAAIADGPAVPKGETTTVRDLIESVEGIPLFKIFLCYQYPWWKAVGVTTGRSLTDMPIRQTYYWAIEPKDDHTDGNSALLASYDDDLSVTFWAGLRDRHANPLFEPRLDYSGDAAGSDEWKTYRAPKAMVEEAHRQVQRIHDMPFAPLPYDAAYRDWAEDPFGGGVNFWRIHAKSWEVIPAIIKPKANAPIYICGEAYSHQQGWVEGSLQTAEMMLTTYFHLSPRVHSSSPAVKAPSKPLAANGTPARR